nr:ribonuclease H-like domain-containing protein [Tanacetum cinerariifolium]
MNTRDDIEMLSAIFTTVALLFFWQWQPSSLAVGSSSASGNSITGSGNALCILFLAWNAVKARFGGNAESKKIRKSMLKQEFLEFRIGEAEGLHKGYDTM